MADSFSGLQLQESPPILVAAMPGNWLLKRTTPSWRIEDPETGFQRQVSEKRARQIAASVLDQHRTFPNAIVLATDSRTISHVDGHISIPRGTRFLVVDGQHRLWAQRFSEYEADYCCIIHPGLSEQEMATLFIEINDNQKRVPASLRWDLVRLVRPDDDPGSGRAADLVYELSTKSSSPLRQRIDLTGEQSQITLKQASLAPEIKSLVTRKGSPLKELGFDIQYDLIAAYFAAIRERDADGWSNASSPLYKARVLRALLRLMPEVVSAVDKAPEKVSARDMYKYIGRIQLDTLQPDAIRGQQGSAGIKAILDTIREQVFAE